MSISWCRSRGVRASPPPASRVAGLGRFGRPERHQVEIASLANIALQPTSGPWRQRLRRCILFDPLAAERGGVEDLYRELPLVHCGIGDRPPVVAASTPLQRKQMPTCSGLASTGYFGVRSPDSVDESPAARFP